MAVLFSNAYVSGLEELLQHVEKHNVREFEEEKALRLAREKKIREVLNSLQTSVDGFGSRLSPNYPQQKIVITQSIESNHGFHKKLDFAPGTLLALHGDYHGNRKALDVFSTFVNNLSKSSGRMVVPFILGDLVDRGPESFSTLSAAMQIPNVEIVKGNHESLKLNKAPSGMVPEERELLEDSQIFECVRQSYALFPSCILVGCSEPSPSARKEAILLTHGAFEIDYDYSRLLAGPTSLYHVTPKKVGLVPELASLFNELPLDWNQKPLVDVYDYVRSYLQGKNCPPERIDMICAALRLHIFLVSPAYPSDHPPELAPPFPGDLSKMTMAQGLQMQRDLGMSMSQWARIRSSIDRDCLSGYGLFLSVKTAQAFMCLQNKANFSLIGFIKAHEHVEENFDNRVNGYTLPAAPSEAIFMPVTTGSPSGGTPPVSALHKDAVLVLEVTGPEIARWNASRYTRFEQEETFTPGPCNISWMHSVNM